MNGTAHETEVSGCMNKRRLRIIKYVAIAVAVMVFAWGASAIAVYAVSSGRVFDSASMDAVPRRRVAVVLGCVRTLPNGLNNLYFSRRIDAAAELYKAGKVDCLIVSGDNHVKGYDEPSDMKESLMKAGVPADRIVCDYAGFRTLDTVVRAKKVFGLDSFIVVSQPDHVRPAVFTARGFGCDAYGYAAEDVNGRYSIKTTIREQLAKIAAVADVILRRSPKFLGPREALPGEVRGCGVPRLAGRRMGRAEGHPLRHPRRDLLRDSFPVQRKEIYTMKRNKIVKFATWGMRFRAWRMHLRRALAPASVIHRSPTNSHQALRGLSAQIWIGSFEFYPQRTQRAQRKEIGDV